MPLCNTGAEPILDRNSIAIHPHERLAWIYTFSRQKKKKFVGGHLDSSANENGVLH
jgi:hypothetical protein